MPRSRVTRVRSVALVLAALCVTAAQAQLGSELLDSTDAVEFSTTQRGGGISLQEAVQMATERRPGRVVRAVTVETGGRRVHEIRILLEEGGRVITVRIDAQTGESR